MIKKSFSHLPFRGSKGEMLKHHGAPATTSLAFGGLLRRTVCFCPTWKGWVLLLIFLCIASVGATTALLPFLQVTAAAGKGVLVVEGWVPDYALAHAVREFRRGGYHSFFVTGVPIDKGIPFSEHKTYAEFGAATIRQLAPGLEAVEAVPAPRTRKDRTYVSALALKEWLKERGRIPRQIDVVSLGPHARRSRLLFQKAFGNTADVGVIAVPDESFDANRWWAVSSGVRTVLGESLAYCYARFFFWPRAD